MNQIVRQEQTKPGMLDVMADKYGLLPQEFADTVRATCGLKDASREEFAAFLMVAREYDLNPILKEIYAFPRRGGGIVPIVSIDGWVNLINSHGQCDGFTFQWMHDNEGNLISCTCLMYRKDRTHPVEVTEYLDECVRNTDPWKMKHRMLRHKAMIQAARYAFGFAGIYDEDEGHKIANAPMRDVTPEAPPPPPPPEPEAEIVEEAPVQDAGPPPPPPDDDEAPDAGELLEKAETWFDRAEDVAGLDDAFTNFENLHRDDLDDADWETVRGLYGQRLEQLEPNPLGGG